jgi:hypothetical protein
MDKIVNSESMFILLSIYQKIDNNDSLEIVVDGRDYTKIILTINKLENSAFFIKKIKGVEGRHIDIEILEDGTMDFWSEDYHIGAFGFDFYEEIIINYNREDWIKYTEILQNSLEEKDGKLQNIAKVSKMKFDFINDLILFLNKEIGNTKIKNYFFENTNQVEKINTEKLKLAESILRIIEANNIKWNS